MPRRLNGLNEAAMTDKLTREDRAKAMATATPEDGVALLAGLSAPDAYRLILEHPQPERVVALMPVENVYLLLHEIGTDDALVLLEIADPVHVQGFVDIDCWDRDHLDVPKARTWFVLLNELDDAAFWRHVQGMDLALLVAFFDKHLRVHKLDNPDDEIPHEGLTFVTPDGRHLIEYTCGAEPSRLINALLWRISRLDLDFFLRLIEAIYWESGAEVEETAYEDRGNRLESRGFPDYYAALEILTTVDLDRFAPANKIAPPPIAKTPGASLASSQYLVKYDHPPSLLRRVLAKPFDGRDDIAVELMGLANMATVAARTPFFELDAVRRLVSRTDGLVSIGLEYLSGGKLAAARRCLQDCRLIDLHKIGRSLVMREVRRARALVPRTAVDGKSAHRLLLDGPEGELLTGLLLPEPSQLRDGREELWTELAQVEDARARLGVIERLVALFEEVLGPAPAKQPPPSLALTNVPDPAELSYRVLFNTFRCHDLLGRGASIAPLALTDLPKLRKLLVNLRTRPALSAKARKQFAAWLRQRVGDADAPALEAVFDRYAGALAQELARTDLEPRFRQEVLLRLKSAG
jgi:hypothetical protein